MVEILELLPLLEIKEHKLASVHKADKSISVHQAAAHNVSVDFFLLHYTVIKLIHTLYNLNRVANNAIFTRHNHEKKVKAKLF